MSINSDEETSAKRSRMDTQDSSNSQESMEYKPSAGNSSLSSTLYTSTNTLSRTHTKQSGILAGSLITAPASKLSAIKKQGSKRALLEIELLQDKIRNQKVKHEKELAHQTEMFDIEYKILLLEYEHKKKMFDLVEAEQKAKLDKIRTEI